MAARWLGSPAEAQSEADEAEAEAGGASVSGFTTEEEEGGWGPF